MLREEMKSISTRVSTTSNSLQTGVSRTTDTETKNMSISREKVEELQKAIAYAQSLVSSIPLNELEDQTIKSMMKDALGKLASVQRIILESEKCRFKSLQSSTIVSEIETVEVQNYYYYY